MGDYGVHAQECCACTRVLCMHKDLVHAQECWPTNPCASPVGRTSGGFSSGKSAEKNNNAYLKNDCTFLCFSKKTDKVPLRFYLCVCITKHTFMKLLLYYNHRIAEFGTPGPWDPIFDTLKHEMFDSWSMTHTHTHTHTRQTETMHFQEITDFL